MTTRLEKIPTINNLKDYIIQNAVSSVNGKTGDVTIDTSDAVTSVNSQTGDVVIEAPGDNVFHAEGTNTDINNSNSTVSWNNTVMNDSAYSFNGSTVTIQEAGSYEISADADFSSNTARSNANIGVQKNGNWAGVIGRSGYVRDNSGHNSSSVHTRATLELNSGDNIRIRTIQEAQGDNVVPNRSQFTIKKLIR